MPDMATGDESAPPRPALPRLHSTLAPTRSRPEEIELDGIVPEAHHFAGGSSHDPLVWISPNGTEVPLPEVPALRFGGADGALVIARFTAPNEDVVLDTAVPDSWVRHNDDGSETLIKTTLRSGQVVQIAPPPEAKAGAELEFDLPLSELVAEITPVPLLIDAPPPKRARPTHVQVDGVVPPAHHLAGGSSRDPLVWITPSGTKVRLPAAPTLRIGGGRVIARFVAPNEDVALSAVVPDRWARRNPDGSAATLDATLRTGQPVRVAPPPEATADASAGAALAFTVPLSDIVDQISPVTLQMDSPPPVDTGALSQALANSVRKAAALSGSDDPRLLEALKHAVLRLLQRINSLDDGLKSQLRAIAEMLRQLDARLTSSIDAAAQRVLDGASAKVDERAGKLEALVLRLHDELLAALRAVPRADGAVPAHDFGVQVGGWERGAQAGGCDEGTQTQTASEACQTDASPRASPRVVVRKKAAPPAQPSKAPPIEPPPRPKRGINWYHQTNRGPPGHQQGHYMRWM